MSRAILRAFHMKFVNVGSKSPKYFFRITDAQSRNIYIYINQWRISVLLENSGLLQEDIKKPLEDTPKISSLTKERGYFFFCSFCKEEHTTRYFYWLYLINFIPFWIEIFFDDLALENLVAHTDDSIRI